jgi:aspartyl-tRNA synthetase
LLALKTSYKDLTGEDFGGAKPEEKKKKEPVVQEKKSDGPSKAELNKLKRKEAKAAAKAAAKGDDAEQAAETQKSAAASAGDNDEAFAYLYGDSPLVCSATQTDRAYRQIIDLSEDKAGQNVWIRGRLATSRAVGKGCFIVLRQQISTVQAVMFQGSQVPKAMVKYGVSIPSESIVDIFAEVS